MYDPSFALHSSNNLGYVTLDPNQSFQLTHLYLGIVSSKDSFKLVLWTLYFIKNQCPFVVSPHKMRSTILFMQARTHIAILIDLFLIYLVNRNTNNVYIDM